MSQKRHFFAVVELILLNFYQFQHLFFGTEVFQYYHGGRGYKEENWYKMS